MLEGFKINCFPLNRAIRISIALPKDYNNTSRYYPVIYFLDGQNLYKDEDSYRGKSLGLEKIIEELSFNGKEAIYVGIAAASAPERREAEYASKDLADFILSSIHPYLLTRYRMNSYVYCFACSQASYTALLLNQDKVVKGIILLSPVLNSDDLEQLEFPTDHLMYLYAGRNEENGTCLNTIYALHDLVPHAEIVSDDNAIHNESGWSSQVLIALNYLVL